MKNKKEMVTTGEGRDIEEWSGKVMSPQDSGMTTGGAGIRRHGDIQETLEGRGRHCRCKEIWGKLGPVLVRLAVAMEVIGRLQRRKQWGLRDLVEEQMGYSQGGQGALQDPWGQMLLGYPRKGRAWFNWLIFPSPSLTPPQSFHPQSLPLPT